MTGESGRLQKVRRAGSSVVLVVTLLFLFSGQCAAIACVLFPIVAVVPTLSVTYTPATPGPPPTPATWTVTPDPCAVSSFQLDLLFDPTMTVMSASILSPYSGAATLVSPGDLQFAGSEPPTVGDVNIFQVVFQGTSQPGRSIFTVSGTGTDIIDIVNTAEGMTTTVGPSGIMSVSGSAVPEPSSLVLFSSALTGLVGVLRKRRA
jgi:PEP-CTERM motif